MVWERRFTGERAQAARMLHMEGPALEMAMIMGLRQGQMRGRG
jgi:hypothetical protein